MNSTLRRTPFFAAAALLAVCVAPLSAAPITFTFTGIVDNVDPALASDFAPGDAFTMSYTFESTTPARVGSDSTFAVFDALTSTDFTLNAYAGSATGSEEIQVDNDPPFPNVDRYSAGPGAGSTKIGPQVNGLDLASFFVRLDDSTNTVFSDALILPLSLSLSDFTSAGFAVFFANDIGDIFVVDGHITTLVPEPTSMMLALVGVVAVAGYARRRRV